MSKKLYVVTFTAEIYVEAENEAEAEDNAWHDVITDIDHIKLSQITEIEDEK